MYQYNSNINDTQSEPDLTDENIEEDKSSSNQNDKDPPSTKIQKSKFKPPEFLQEFSHVIQFCHLCVKGKIPPVLYSIASNPEIDTWFSSLKLTCLPKSRGSPKRSSTEPSSSNDEDISSPKQNLSCKDHYLIHMMLKLHDTIDKHALKKI
jgi:hypothetical protein